MAILKIARMGHPVLRRPAEPIADPKAPEIHALIADMIETMVDAGGAGLAAPQVHRPLRLAIFQVPRGRIEDDVSKETPLTVLINPVIEPIGDEMLQGWEGCLSVPGLRGLVARHAHIRYRGLDPRGQPVEREATGFHARVVQHECDHLDGILYPQRMGDLSLLIFDSEVRHWIESDSDEADPVSAEAESAEAEDAA